MGGVTIDFRRPSEALARLVTAFYFVEIDHDESDPVQDLLHPEWGNIRFASRMPWIMGTRAGPEEAPAASLFGPSSRTRSISGTGLVCGIGLTPLGWARLVRTNAGALADRVVPLASILPALAAEHSALIAAPSNDVRVAVIEARLLAMLAPPNREAELLAHAHQHLLDPAIATVEQFAAALGLPKSRLSRLCIRNFGFPPKLLLRRQRFLRTLSVMRDRLDEPWVSLIDPIYVDQSHFIRDFHYFMGMAPRSYFALPHAILAQAAIGRSSVIGASLQGLHDAA